MRFKVFQKIFITVLLLLVFSFSHLFAEEKKYPPYSDVWGFELPWPEDNSRYSGIKIAKMPDGDYLIIYMKNRIYLKGREAKDFNLRRDAVNKYAGVFFFASKEIEIGSRDEYNKFMEKMTKEKRLIPSLRDRHQATLSSSYKISEKSLFGSSAKCVSLFSDFIQKTDKSGKIIAKKHLIYLLDKPFKESVNQNCEYNWSLGKDYVITKVVGRYTFSFVPLEDDTFLVFETNGNYILRFDENFNTKSDLLNKRIFLIDTEIIENMRARLGDKYNDQTLADAIYNYIIKTLKKEG